MRRWVLLAGGVLAAAALAWTAVGYLRPEASCACTGAPYLAGTSETADRFVAAVRAGDAEGAWTLLTPQAQRRRGSVATLTGELPELGRRFAAPDGTWHRVYLRSQGYDTPTTTVLVLVSGRTAVSALVVHSRATREDPGLVDPDLGEPLRLGAAQPDGRAPVANPADGTPTFTRLPSGMVIAVVQRPDGRYAFGAAAPAMPTGSAAPGG